LQAELKRVTEERDILKRPPRTSPSCPGEVRLHVRSRARVPVAGDVSCVRLHRSGYYAWLRRPLSVRAREDDRLLGLVKQSWLQSGTVYGYRKVIDNLCEQGEACGKHRVARGTARLWASRPSHHGGMPSTVAPNHLDRHFEATKPNKPRPPAAEARKTRARLRHAIQLVRARL
jgi:putative transposase